MLLFAVSVIKIDALFFFRQDKSLPSVNLFLGGQCLSLLHFSIFRIILIGPRDGLQLCGIHMGHLKSFKFSGKYALKPSFNCGCVLKAIKTMYTFKWLIKSISG